MKLRKVAIFTVLSGAMLFATVGAAHADDEATPTLYSTEVCADGSTPTLDDSGNSVCAGDVAVTATSDTVCADGSDPIVDMNGDSVCPNSSVETLGGIDGVCTVSSDGTQTACPLGAIRRDANLPTGGVLTSDTTPSDPAATDCSVDGTSADTTADPATNCALMYSTVLADNQKEFKSNTASTDSNNSIVFALLGIAAVVALSFGARKLSR
jgi:hypothetical protein